MAIERMKSIWLFAPQGQAREVIDLLATTGLAHVVDCGLSDSSDHDALGIEHVYPEVTDLERKVQALNNIFATLSRFHRARKSFLENFIPTPVEVREADARKALESFDVETFDADLRLQRQHHDGLVQALQEAGNNLKALAPLAGVTTTIPGRQRQQHVAAFLGVMPLDNFEKLKVDERLSENAVAAVAAEKGRDAIVQAVCPRDEGQDLLALLRERGMNVVEPEQQTLTVKEYIERRREQVTRLRKEVRETAKELRKTSSEHYRTVEMVLGYWEERLRIAGTTSLLVESKRLTALKAYVRQADLAQFEMRMAAELPQVAVEVRDPEPGEDVPVSLKNPKLYSSIEFVAGMFGLPNYFSFDPTPYIAVSFLLFFGICFGDVIYGLLLVAVGSLLARKYRDYPTLRGLFKLFAVAGVPTIIVGALTGAWASDLLTETYLGEGSRLSVFTAKLTVLDMTKKTLIALGIALGLGVANQFLGLICLMVRNVREGDTKAAIFDGAFWVLVLPAVVICAAGLFVPVPRMLTAVALSAAALGAVGLVLTQGRAEKTFLGKALVGIVSLYGIVGTYGITAFIGDVLSYSRLLALGMTTSVVGFCVNLIAGMTRGIPAVGIIIFLVIVIPGHAANFLISILGAFVHSIRLIFVEFFGRFYEAGAAPFAPIGTWSKRIRVVDARTVWVDRNNSRLTS